MIGDIALAVIVTIFALILLAAAVGYGIRYEARRFPDRLAAMTPDELTQLAEVVAERKAKLTQ